MNTDSQSTMLGNHLSPNAVNYTIQCILNIVGVPKNLYIVHGTTVNIGEVTVKFHLANREEQDDLFQGKMEPVFIDSYDGQIHVPLFGTNQFSDWDGTTLTICADILTISFALLSRLEETFSDKRDKYGRLSYIDSLACQYGFIQMPLVDEYAMLLKQELTRHGLGNMLESRRPNMIPTHDVDELWRFPSLLEAAKSIVGGDLMIRKSIKIAIRSCKQLAMSLCRPEKDPLYLACLELMEVSQKSDLTSIFYFLGYGEEKDCRYHVTHPSVHQIMLQLEQGGCTVGFHGGFGTYKSVETFAEQKGRVDAAYEKKTIIGRQHYLCFDALSTPKIWDESGIQEDQTLSFFDHEGFRCGTCRPYPLYDLLADQPLSVLERPLILMDGTVKDYRNLSIDEALTSARTLRDRVFAVGGDFVILWHNSLINRGMENWYHNFYVAFIEESAKILKQNNFGGK